jgi:peroxiredoxin family protein
MSTTRVAIIASRGTLDWAYPPFILASTAAALGFEVKMFFTFYGLQLLRQKLDLRMSPLGNPAMPMPFPVPVVAQSLPGMEQVVTEMMKAKLKAKNIAPVDELRALTLEAGATLIACQMTMDLFDFKREDFVEGVEVGGAATFLEFAAGSQITLFI